MTKRIISLVLCFAVLGAALVLPASAGGTGFYIDLIDLYGFLSGSFTGSTTRNITMGLINFGFIEPFAVFDWEMTISVSGDALTEVRLKNSYNNTWYYSTDTVITANGVIVSGSMDGALFDFGGFYLSNYGSSSTYNILSLKIYLQRYQYTDLACTLWSPFESKYISKGSQGQVFMDASGYELDSNCFMIKIPYDWWSGLACVELHAMVGAFYLDAVTVYLEDEGTYIPFEMSEWDNPGTGPEVSDEYNYYYFNLSADLTGIDFIEQQGKDLIINISISYGMSTAWLYLYNLRGLYASETAISEVSLLAKIELMLVQFIMMYPELSQGVVAVNTEILNAVGLIDSKLENLAADISYFFAFDPDNIYDPEFTNPLWAKILEPLFGILERLEVFQESMENRFETAIGLLRQMVSGDPVDSEVTQGMEQSKGELDTMTEQMGSLNPPPDPEDIEVNIQEFIPSGETPVNAIMHSMFDFEPVTTFVLLTFSFALIGFVFFGKR